MTFRNHRGLYPFWEKTPLSPSPLAGRGLRLLLMALAATGIAFLLSLPGTSVWAWHQSPTSPVLPIPTEPDQMPTPSPTAPASTPTATLEPTAAPDDQLSTGSTGSTTLLVAGGIVFAGLVAGAVALLVRGRWSDESTP